MVECSPATRAARVRFPADASFFLFYIFRSDSMSIIFFLSYIIRFNHSLQVRKAVCKLEIFTSDENSNGLVNQMIY